MATVLEAFANLWGNNPAGDAVRQVAALTSPTTGYGTFEEVWEDFADTGPHVSTEPVVRRKPPAPSEQPDPKPVNPIQSSGLFPSLLPSLDFSGVGDLASSAATDAAQTALITSLPFHGTLFEYDFGEFELTQNGKYAAYGLGGLLLYFFVLRK